MQFGDGSSHRLEERAFARVDAATVRKIRILGPADTVYVCAGGKDGYIGHDGRTPEGMECPGPLAETQNVSVSTSLRQIWGRHTPLLWGSMDLELAGKVFLITGGSSGLGKALAEQLVREGAGGVGAMARVPR